MLPTLLLLLSFLPLSLQSLCHENCFQCDQLLGECLECLFLSGPDAYFGMFRNRCYFLCFGCEESVFEVEGSKLIQRCVRCKEHYSLTDSFTCKDDLELVEECMDPNCISCSPQHLDYCETCKYANVKLDGTCYKEEVITANCATMAEDVCIECLQDIDQYYYTLQGRYLTPDNQCRLCSEHCTQCNSDKDCQLCYQGYYLEDNACHKYTD